MTTTTLGYEDLPRLMSLMTGDEKHSPAATSTLDVVWTLYDQILDVDPADPDHPDLDRFYLSKGHGPMAFYAVLAVKGFIGVEELPHWAGYESHLGWHPDRVLIPGVEIGSGSLGHGLGMAVGAALALDARGQEGARVVCLLGDGELDEGSNHEAIAFAARAGLDRLTAIVIDNQSARHGWPGGVHRRFAVEGWGTSTVNGRDHAALREALTTVKDGRPHAVVAVVERR